METIGVCATNGGMNGGHEQRKGVLLCLLTNLASAYNITMIGSEFGDTTYNCFLGLLVLSIYRQSKTYGWFMLAQRLARDTSPAARPDQFVQYM
ncbi:hypothetical protein TNCV_898901 [Trichonephila clavipes]|nr:hypothetical protein TNCV_898901 [Trichonephila clavipes]